MFSSRSKFLMKNLWGMEVMTPAPSPSRTSDPTAPLWVMLQRRLRAVAMSSVSREFDRILTSQVTRRRGLVILFDLPSLTILWLGLPLIWLYQHVSHFVLFFPSISRVREERRMGGDDIPSKANTTCIFLEARVIQAPDKRQSPPFHILSRDE